MAYSLRYRKSPGSKGNNPAQALFEPLDNYEYNEVGYKMYQPRYYRMDIVQSKSEIATLTGVTLLALATRLWMINATDTSVLVFV